MKLRKMTLGATPARRTRLSFTGKDLAELAKLIGAGQVLLQVQHAPPVVARLKAALTRLGLPVPKGP